MLEKSLLEEQQRNSCEYETSLFLKNNIES